MVDIVAQCREKVHKQHIIDMPNGNPTRACPIQTIFNWLTFGHVLSLLGFAFGTRGFAMGPWGFVLGLGAFLGTNRLVLVVRKSLVSGLYHCEHNYVLLLVQPGTYIS